MARTIVRRARKQRIACHLIRVGDLYLESTAFPGDEMGFVAKHPVKCAECRACAERYGRGHLFAAREDDRG